MWADERVGRISRDARVLFVGLITLADDEGRFRALPSVILGHIFPYDNDAARKLTGWVDELLSQGLVEVYSHDDMPYGVIPKWLKHQKISHSRPSILPSPSVNGNRTLPKKVGK